MGRSRSPVKAMPRLPRETRRKSRSESRPKVPDTGSAKSGRRICRHLVMSAQEAKTGGRKVGDGVQAPKFQTHQSSNINNHHVTALAFPNREPGRRQAHTGGVGPDGAPVCSDSRAEFGVFGHGDIDHSLRPLCFHAYDSHHHVRTRPKPSTRQTESAPKWGDGGGWQLTR